MTSNRSQKNSFLLTLAAFCIPIVGFVLYFLRKAEQPERANAILEYAIAGSIVNLIFFLIRQNQ